jgi:hypothetical protein
VDGKLFHALGYNAGLRDMPQALAYNTLYVRASTLELDAYRGRGDPRPTKHLRAIHEKYRNLIERQVSQEVKHSKTKPPKVPEPKAYEGEDNAELFEVASEPPQVVLDKSDLWAM